MVEHLEYPFGPVRRECVVEHGCQVKQAYGGGEDGCADDAYGPTPLDCIQDENWGSSHGSEQANAMAYAVRDLLPHAIVRAYLMQPSESRVGSACLTNRCLLSSRRPEEAPSFPVPSACALSIIVAGDEELK